MVQMIIGNYTLDIEADSICLDVGSFVGLRWYACLEDPLHADLKKMESIEQKDQMASWRDGRKGNRE